VVNFSKSYARKQKEVFFEHTVDIVDTMERSL